MQETSLLSLLDQITKLDVFDPRTWYFGFCRAPSNTIPAWQRFFIRKDPPHLHHCYAFAQVGDFVLFIEPTRQKIEFVVKYPTPEHPVMSAEAIAQELADKGHVIVRHTFLPMLSEKTLWNWIPSCVTVVKCATGFPSYARTPKQLLHRLIKEGAHVFLGGE